MPFTHKNLLRACYEFVITRISIRTQYVFVRIEIQQYLLDKNKKKKKKNNNNQYNKIL